MLPIRRGTQKIAGAWGTRDSKTFRRGRKRETAENSLRTRENRRCPVKVVCQVPANGRDRTKRENTRETQENGLGLEKRRNGGIITILN